MKFAILIMFVLPVGIRAQEPAPTPAPITPTQIQKEIQKASRAVDKLTRDAKEDAGPPANKSATQDPTVALRNQIKEQQAALSHSNEQLAKSQTAVAQLQKDLAAQKQAVNERNADVLALWLENQALRHNIKRRAVWRILTCRW